MRNLIYLLLILSTLAFSGDCSLKNNMMPKCYHKRSKAELNISLLYYGDYWKLVDLERIEPLLKERFLRATGNRIKLNVLVKKVLSFKQKAPANYKYNNITDKDRLQRIWYYDNVGAGVMKEVYEEYKKVESAEILDKLDAILAITGAQFDGLGFASGRVSVTEQPREIAWGLEDGGHVEYVTDYKIVDELIHELGHNMFLGHTSTQCQKPGMTFQEKEICCEESPSKNDVLSYCRNRNNVDIDFMHGFEICNQDMIQNKVIPAMLKGGQWNISNRTSCR